MFDDFIVLVLVCIIIILFVTYVTSLPFCYFLQYLIFIVCRNIIIYFEIINWSLVYLSIVEIPKCNEISYNYHQVFIGIKSFFELGVGFKIRYGISFS